MNWKPHHLVTTYEPINTKHFTEKDKHDFKPELDCVKVIDNAIYKMIGSKYSQDNDLLPKAGDSY